MANDYQNSLARLNQLADNPTSASFTSLDNVHPQTRTTQRRQDNRPQWQQIQWVSILIAVLSQLAIWWIYPAIYSKNLAGGQWQHNPLLMTYSVILALAIFLTFNRGFSRWLNFGVILIPMVFLYFLYQQVTMQQIILLVLLPLALLLINLKWLNLQNILGLVLYSGIATLALPVVIFYQQNTFLTAPFIWSLLPLLFSYLFYMSSIFVTTGRDKRATSLAFGIILLLDVLTLPWNPWTLLAIMIIVFTWMVLINLNLKAKYRMGVFSLLQAITVLVIFLQQK